MKILVLMVSVLIVSAMSNSGTNKFNKLNKISKIKQCDAVDWDACLWNDKDDIEAHSQCLKWVTSCMNKLGTSEDNDIKQYL